MKVAHWMILEKLADRLITNHLRYLEVGVQYADSHFNFFHCKLNKYPTPTLSAFRHPRPTSFAGVSGIPPYVAHTGN